MAKNKVRFGLKNVHFCTYEVADDGTVTLGSPYHLPGSTELSLEAQSESADFYADDVKYWSGYSDNGYEGSLTNANFPDDFKTTFMNYVQLDDGGIGQIKGMKNKNVCIMFEGDGDKEKRRGILYNVALGQINRTYATVEESIEPQTAELEFTVNGDNGTGLVQASYGPDSAAYETIFTNPPLPALPEES